jgi:hypothetical protein
MNPDAVRQLLRQERLRWNLKPNKDSDYYSNTTGFKYSTDLHNEGVYQRMEIRTFPDNEASPGYAGVNVDSGEFGIVHDLEQWDHAISEESPKQIVNRIQIGAMAKIAGTDGYGLNDDKEMVQHTNNRMASIMFDPYDGRAYLMTNDDPLYVNNETRTKRLPLRTVARVGDIPTRITDLKNDLDFISDPDYRHTDNNFTDSNRFLVDNLDDRTFVYPEVSKYKNIDGSGTGWIRNLRVGLSGENTYNESDGEVVYNQQPDVGENPDLGKHGDRFGEKINSYNANKRFSGTNYPGGYFPGIFRSLEELERVDLVHQSKNVRIHSNTPAGRRSENYYVFDGKWSPTWFDRYTYRDSYLAQSIHPTNMELGIEGQQPVSFNKLSQNGEEHFNTAKLYQWRYNRISMKYHSEDIDIYIRDPGVKYEVGDILRWTFTDEVILYKVKEVSPLGQIQEGEYVNNRSMIFEQDPSTYGVGIPFSNMSGVGSGALLEVSCKVRITTHATQIKNNLYAYVDVVPTVRSQNNLEWSDINPPDSQEGKINLRSTAAYPAYSGINSGRGGAAPNPATSTVRYHEHGGNATAGCQVHLFRYVINTQTPEWVEKDGIQVFLGRWVDQGPLSVERPCDIKALYLSNFDTNNFNNYYKFMLDSLFDAMNRIPDAVSTNNDNATSPCYLHIAQRDPERDQRFTAERVNPNNNKIEDVDITSKVLYINGATGVLFVFNTSHKNDPTFGYSLRSPGWCAISGVTTR